METYLTQSQFEDLIYAVTVAMLGGSPPADVRISWPTGGAPNHKVNEDVIYLRVAESDNEYNREREFQFEDSGSPVDSLTQRLSYTRVMGVNWICYGPNSYENATIIRDSIQFQAFHDMLADYRVFHIPGDIAPHRVPEEFPGGQWVERVDLMMEFYEEIKKESVIGFVKSVDVVVETESGSTRDITIAEE